MRFKKICNKRIGNCRVEVGTIDHNNPQVIFVEGKIFVSPINKDFDYSETVKNIENEFKSYIKKSMKTIGVNSNDLIIDFQLTSNFLDPGKKSFLYYQYMFKQNELNFVSGNKLKEDDFLSNNVTNKLLSLLTNNYFITHFSKK